MRADAVLAVKRRDDDHERQPRRGRPRAPGDRAIATSGPSAARKLSPSRKTPAARDRIGRTAAGIWGGGRQQRREAERGRASDEV